VWCKPLHLKLADAIDHHGVFGRNSDAKNVFGFSMRPHPRVCAPSSPSPRQNRQRLCWIDATAEAKLNEFRHI